MTPCWAGCPRCWPGSAASSTRTGAVDDGIRIDRISLLEKIKAAVGGGAVRGDRGVRPVPGRRAAGRRGGLPPAGQGIAEQVGLATKTVRLARRPQAHPGPRPDHELPARSGCWPAGRSRSMWRSWWRPRPPTSTPTSAGTSTSNWSPPAARSWRPSRRPGWPGGWPMRPTRPAAVNRARNARKDRRVSLRPGPGHHVPGSTRCCPSKKASRCLCRAQPAHRRRQGRRR